jgi:hypothetical protein
MGREIKLWPRGDMAPVKRAYVPGTGIKLKCECGADIEQNWGRDYPTTYPSGPFKLHGYCHECDAEPLLGMVTLQVVAVLVPAEGFTVVEQDGVLP